MDKLTTATVSVWAYRGELATPQWKDIDTDNYTKLCSIVVDLKHLAPIADQYKRTGPDGTVFFRLHYKLILLFGLSELKAVFSWKENVSRMCVGIAMTDSNISCRVWKRGRPRGSCTIRSEDMVFGILWSYPCVYFAICEVHSIQRLVSEITNLPLVGYALLSALYCQ